MIRNNWQYKLLALIVAIFLWLYVNSERFPQTRSKPISVPVQITNQPRGYSAELSSREVSVTLEGLKAVVESIRRNDITVWVDLEDFDVTGENTEKQMKVQVKISDVNSGEVVCTIEPSEINVKLEAITGKRLPVEIKYLSTPPLGYAFGNPSITPASAGVSGKSKFVSQVKRIAITLNKQASEGSIDEIFPLTAMDESGNVVHSVGLEPSNVRLQLALIEVPATKAVVISPTLVGEPKFPAKVTKVTVDPASVSIEGRPDALAKISTIATQDISLSQIDKTFSKDVALIIPRGVALTKRGDVKVTVHIEEK